MMRQSVLALIAISSLSVFSAGCGGSVAPGVADAPEPPPPVLTPDERKGEQNALKSARGQ